MNIFSTILTFLVAASVLALAAAGGSGDVMLTGAQEAVEFLIGISGGILLWSAVMQLMEESGLSGKLARLLRPLLCRLFPESCRQGHVLSALTENVSANLLGLGNAATPAGIRAAKGMAALGQRARDELCMLVVLNTASIQLLPSTVAALRASLGAASAFDILPAVWLSSAFSLGVGLTVASVLRRLWK